MACHHTTCSRPQGGVSSYGGSLIDDTVAGVEPGFHVRLAIASPLRARRIPVATGPMPPIPAHR
jgi:hypothetical protein